MITLTAQAANKFKQQLEERGMGIGIRLAVRGTGCSGYSYLVNFADKCEEDDLVFEYLGVTILVDPDSYVLVKNTHIDFQKNGFNEALKFINPNVKGECGCGESFTI